MPFYQFTKEQKIPAHIDEVWDFVSSPSNLKIITPADMGFEMLDQDDMQKMYAGMMIRYKVKPIPGIKLSWVTEISQVKEREYFVDEQRMGPYQLWHHQHKFEVIEGGVLMTDIVSYIPPLGFIGALANFLFIKKRLDEIFHFRYAALEQYFGSWKSKIS